MADGRVPDNSVRLADLGALERQSLKESLAIVRQFKAWLSWHYGLDSL
jgi:CBS domain-containing protein